MSWFSNSRRLPRLGFFVLSLALVSESARCHDQLPAQPQREPILLRGGTLHTVTRGVLENHDLLLAEGKIAALGRALQPPPGARVVELNGALVYPGLIALQTTLGLAEIEAVRATVDTVETGDSTPEVEAHVAFNPDSEVIPTVRSQGIAVAQVSPGFGRFRGGFGGSSFVVRLDGWTKEDAGYRLRWGQQLFWPEPMGMRNPFGPPRSDDRKALRESLNALEKELQAAREYLSSRRANPAAGSADLRWEGLRGVLEKGEPLFIVAETAEGIGQALDLLEREKLRGVIVGGFEAETHAKRLRQLDIPVVVGSTHRVPFREDMAWDAAYTLPARLDRAGVRVALAMPARFWDVRNLPFQVGQAVAFGLDPEVGLRAVTLEPARILGLESRLGSLEVGKDATLVVSLGNLFDPLTQRVTHLFLDGREVDLDNRHKRLERKYRERIRTAQP